MNAGAKPEPWTIDELQRLETQWHEGKTTALIAVDIGKSKNSIVGKAHRIGLPSRPNPVKQKELTPEEIAERERVRLARRKPLKAELPPLPPETEPEPRKPPKQEAKPMPTARVYAFRPAHTCQWIDADPTTGPWSYCGKPCVSDAADKAMPSPYCADHHKRAYVRVSDHARRAQERQLPVVRPE